MHIRLKLFQKILIAMMFYSTTFVFIAARGLGKTFLSAVYCCARCILYPGTRVCIASSVRSQAITVLEKIILELKPRSPELCSEIDEKETQINGTKAIIVFKNGSSIKVVTARDTSRGNRCNVLLLDEFRLVPKAVVDTVLKKFLTLRRMPEYSELTDEERKAEYDKEKNLTMYLSSAYFKSSWAFTKCVDTFKAMLDDRRKQFVCSFPYQLSLLEGLLDREHVEDEMSESDFSEVKWSMEMGAIFYGSAEGAFFDFDTVQKNRVLQYPMLPDRLAAKVGNSAKVHIAPKQNGEIRILSADIALMSSKKHDNDATAIFLNAMTPTKSGRHACNIVYTATCEGWHTDDQALYIRKMFDEYSCDYLVLDCQGVGMGIYDALAREIVDSSTGEIYPALSCINDKAMADRCADPTAKKVIWSVKAGAQFNSDCALLLREGFRSGRIRLLQTEYDAETSLSAIKGYNTLTTSEQLQLQLPYINTTLLVDELVKLEHEEVGGKIRVHEKTGARKDRYSSLSYNYYVAVQLEAKAAKKKATTIGDQEFYVIRPPKATATRGGGGRYG